MKERKLYIQALNPFIVIQEGIEKVGFQKATLEPSKTASVKALEELRLSWLRVVDEVRTKVVSFPPAFQLKEASLQVG